MRYRYIIWVCDVIEVFGIVFELFIIIFDDDIFFWDICYVNGSFVNEVCILGNFELVEGVS